MNGTTLSGRYELIERVGGGGMALVYKARDTLLNRHVAVKVLRQQYVHDEEFIRRFRREAQSAASLSHPNVVSIYDVGQDEETHFIVMEYIEGSNLNDIIKAQAPLQTAEAVHIATQICDALEHAHANGIIHRDIKPHNILIGKNGRVKVTDFGIARAITTSTITQTGSVIGSVHYFSPEHAKGVTAGEKSDLYSLGIVLYQMLTARLPFIGESPISVALKHLQEPVEEPRAVNPMIPQSVENVILKSLRKRPEERYVSAGEMLRDLETCLAPERRDEPKWTYASDAEDDAEATRVIPAIRGDMKPAGRPGALDGAGSGEASQSASGAPVWRDGSYVDEEEEERRGNPWVKPLVWFGILLVLLGGAWWGVNKVQEIFVIPTVEVPLVEGLPLERAITEIEAAGLVVEDPIVYEYNREVPLDYVISQTKAGEKVKGTMPIRLYVSKGIEMVEMPALVGLTEAEARAALEELGIPDESVQFDADFSDKEGAGGIIEQFPPALQPIDPLDTSVRVVVSRGREETDMPELLGLTAQEAQAMLERAGLELLEKNIVREPAYFEKGRVFKQFPYQPGDPVKPPGEGIMIYISDGLPKEARATTYTVVIGPKEQGAESAVRILVTDAMGERVEAVNQKVSSEQSFTFEVVTSPSKNASIEVFLDDAKLDQYTWTHRQAEESGGSANAPRQEEPEAFEEEPAEPVDGEPGDEEGQSPSDGTEQTVEGL
ncbi:Stk1 family PASTA domain-containing Ser/Thr kinase [Paenibacillus antri]|uniref:Serine/threonine-protein kinase PrkC n=1 Tax=Paenibacillus antri TaxID=2582848 RepID=A0A5R9GEU2_9BACL|nr:Stk1 family PASTA domain-containing Ser/Thr kinase [Paenibacillus antri]TLS49915.1 Stk1 family PASTA domain-containing Ser/Thr kinase [Paenibacillus antri]